MPGTIPGSEDVAVNKIGKSPSYKGTYILVKENKK